MAVVSLLLTAGAPLEAQDKVRASLSQLDLSCLQNGSTPLHLACGRGRVEVVSMLLAAGASLEAQDNMDDEHKRRNPLHLACCEGHIGVVSLLLTAGASLTAYADVSLMMKSVDFSLSVIRTDQCLSTLLVIKVM
jgi:ankyrin repeat protein